MSTIARSTHELVRCEINGFPSASHPKVPEALTEMCQMTATLYDCVGFNPPWVSYLARVDDIYVGGGAFVGAPKDGQVEIAYFTLPDHEGQGFASLTARSLVALARKADPTVILTAKTMPKDNASTAILRRLGFVQDGVVTDHEIGNAWHWSLR